MTGRFQKVRFTRLILISMVIFVASCSTDSSLPSSSPPPTTPSSPTTESFTYSVYVETESTGKSIENARVVIHVANKAPLDEYTDVNGYVGIPFDVSYVDQAARLIVEADGYKKYWQEINLARDMLPNRIPLSPITSPSTHNLTVEPTEESEFKLSSTEKPTAEPVENSVEEATEESIIEPTQEATEQPTEEPSTESESVEMRPTPIPKSSPTPTTPPTTFPPILLEPQPNAGQVLRIDLEWDWAGILGHNDYFQVEIRNRYNAFNPVIDESVSPIDVAWVKKKFYKYDVIDEKYDREYTWRILVVSGAPLGEKNWSTPENRVWDPGKIEWMSKPSEMRTLYVEPGDQPPPDPDSPDPTPDDPGDLDD